MSNVKKTKGSKKVVPRDEEQVERESTHNTGGELQTAGSVSDAGESGEQVQAAAAASVSEQVPVSEESGSSTTPVKQPNEGMGSPILRSILEGKGTPEKTKDNQSKDKSDNPILKSVLAGSQTPENSPEKKTIPKTPESSPDKTPVLRKILSSKLVVNLPSSPTKALAELQLTSPSKPMALRGQAAQKEVEPMALRGQAAQKEVEPMILGGQADQKVDEQREQARNLPEASRSRTESARTVAESPYNTRLQAKSKRTRDKEQRSASEETAKRKGSDKEFEKPL